MIIFKKVVAGSLIEGIYFAANGMAHVIIRDQFVGAM